VATVDEERLLIQQAQQNDMQALRKLVERHRQNVYFLALDLCGNRQDAEDISQEVFLKAFRSLKKYRGEAKFGSWLYRITVNCAIDIKRRKKLHTLSIHEQTAEYEHPANISLRDENAPDPLELTQGSALQKHIRQALNRLSSRERMVFVLRHYQDLPLREIGDMLEIAEGTVKALLFRAIKRLQKELAFYQTDI
jgi:RNA polymerase sigma-70 factor (ECF subfamily)